MNHKFQYFTVATLITLSAAAVIAANSHAAPTADAPTPVALSIPADKATYREALLPSPTPTPEFDTTPTNKDTATTREEPKSDRKKRKPRPTPKVGECENKLAQTIMDAGFEGHSARLAWSIVMRESHGKPLDESSRYFTGALGAWQIQTSAWSSQPWWSRDAMLDTATQTRIVYKHLTSKGRSFVPWGVSHVTDGGKIVYDFSQYSGWTQTQRHNWIVSPLEANWRDYPC